MQKIRLELTDFSPDSTDRLIRALYSYLKSEAALHPSSEIRLELPNTARAVLDLPAGGGRTLRVPFQNIYYATADRHWSVLRLSGGTLRVRLNFSEVHRRLSGGNFLCSSRGILLNPRYIQSAQKDRFLMADGTSFPIRRKGQKDLLLQWEQYRQDHCAEDGPGTSAHT